MICNIHVQHLKVTIVCRYTFTFVCDFSLKRILCVQKFVICTQIWYRVDNFKRSVVYVTKIVTLGSIEMYYINT